MSAITDWLDYSTKSTGARSRGYRVQVTPTSGSSANPGDTIRFDIPAGRGRNQFLDPSQTAIQFQVKSADAAVMNVDGSGYSVLNRYTLLSSGQILEDIVSYNSAVTTYLDLQTLGVDQAAGGSVMQGCQYDATNNVAKFGAQLAIGNTTAQFLDVHLPLHLSGFIGTACPKLIPVGIMQDLRAEFIVETAANAVVCASATPAWTLQAITLNLFYVDIDPVVANQIYEANGGVYKVGSEGFRNFETVVGSAGSTRTSDSIIIPARFSSVKSLISYWRDNIMRGDSTKYYISNRYNPFTSGSGSGARCSVQYQIGSSLFPNTPITFAQSELFAQMLQSFHALGNAQMNTRCNSTNWLTNTSNVTMANVTSQNAGTAVLAVNTESLCFKSKSFTCGVNTLTSPVILNASTYGSGISVQNIVNTICHYDCIFEISEAGVQVRF